MMHRSSPFFMEKLPHGDYESMSGDTAYCTRANCTLVSKHGVLPVFKPRNDVTMRAKGSRAWREMICWWKDNRAWFGECYHRLGHALYSRKESLQDKELHLKTICYNLLVVNKMKASRVLGEPPLLTVEDT